MSDKSYFGVTNKIGDTKISIIDVRYGILDIIAKLFNNNISSNILYIETKQSFFKLEAIINSQSEIPPINKSIFVRYLHKYAKKYKYFYLDSSEINDKKNFLYFVEYFENNNYYSKFKNDLDNKILELNNLLPNIVNLITEQNQEHFFRQNIKIGATVDIVLKKDQPTGRLTRGIVKRILTSKSKHTRGIKVMLLDSSVGRVQSIIKE